MITLDSVTLPDDLLWTDEYGWSPVAQRVAYTLSGALLVETAVKQAGRPITLSAGDTWGWCDRATVDAVMVMVSDPGRIMTLTLGDARSFQCMFRHQDGAINAYPVIDYAVPESADRYVITINLMEV